MRQSVLVALASIVGFRHQAADRTAPTSSTGECPVCDYPYGDMAHVCIGAASVRSPSA